MHDVAARHRAVAAIREAPVLALAGHVTPDGDALGSMLAMAHLAIANGVDFVASWPNPFGVGHHYRSIPGLDLAVPSLEFPPEPICMLTFDCGSLGRLNELAEPAKRARELIVIDHHASNDRFGTINVVETDAAATALVVRRIAAELGWSLNREVAWCLYTGLVTDTGRFQYECTTSEVFAFAEELASFDLPIARISRELFEEHRFAFLQLTARALARAELDVSRRFVVTTVTSDDFIELGVQYEEVEGLIDLLRTTSEADVACVCKQTADAVHVSMRSIDTVDVGAIAVALGGGGHRLASGFSMNAPLPEVVAAIKALLPSVD